MKKILLIFITLILLTSCAAKREDFYSLSFGDTNVVVGFDSVDAIENIKSIDSFDYELNKKEEKILNHLVIYVDDLNGKPISIDEYQISKGISDTCNDLGGRIINIKGNVCVLNKVVKNRDNVIAIYGDILNSDKEKVDRIEVDYFENEDR